jgi:hypothetical protein
MVVQNPTADHRLAADALRAPAGSEAADPYSALSDLVQHWVSDSVSREIVLIGAASEGDSCANAETAIEDAERAGVIVYALYSHSTYSASRKSPKLDAEGVDPGQVAYQVGGEAYLIGHKPTDTLEPSLADIAEHLANQYLVKFRLTSNTGSGLQAVYVTAGQELMAPDRVWVPELTGLNGK